MKESLLHTFVTSYTGHIQANLDDELVQEALRKGVDLRQYSREIESELRKVELKSIEDCIINVYYVLYNDVHVIIMYNYVRVCV